MEVPAGDRLVIDVTNTDAEQVHDLVLDDGSHSRRLSPGDSARADVGVVGRDIAGWCSVAGHRQRGMRSKVTATGAQASPGAATATTPQHDPVVPDLKQTETALAELLARDLTGKDIKVLMLDGEHIAGRCVIVALAITAGGEKFPGRAAGRRDEEQDCRDRDARRPGLPRAVC